jgi:hypothetical protein
MAGLSFLKGTRALVKSFIARVNTDGGIIEAAKCIGDLDADIVMQPSGYKAETLYIQKPAPVYGVELIVNGDFETDSDWTKGTGWNINGGNANCDGISNNSNLNTTLPFYSGSFNVKINLTIKNYVSGDLELFISGSGFASLNANGNYTFNTLADRPDGKLFIKSRNFNGSIDNVSVKEVLTSSGDFTVDRNSTATRVNSLGLIELVAANVPRLDYTDGNCPSLLLEPQSTNLATRSEDFSNSAWVKAESSIISNTETAPDGTLTADTLIPNVSGNSTTAGNASTNNRLFANFGTVTDITNSIYVKSVSGSTFNFSIYVQVNDSIKSIKTVTVTDKWQRVETSAVLLSEGNRFTVCTEENLYIWGAQAEQSSVASSYIPTNGSTVTRLADRVTGAGDVNTFNNSEGVLYAEIAALSNDATNKAIAISDGSNTNRLLIFYSSSGNKIVSLIVLAGVVQGSLNTTITDITQYAKVAFKYKENDFALWVNGVEVATDLSGSTFPASTLNILSYNSGAGGDLFYGKTKDLRVYNTALTDAELTELTTL